MNAVPTFRVGQSADPRSQSRLQRVSLRHRITWLAAIGVGAAVALVSFAAYFTVRTSLSEQASQQLLERAHTVANSTLAQEFELQALPAAALGAVDLRIGLIQINPGGQISKFVVRDAPAPPLEADEQRVAIGAEAESIRTDARTDTRVAAVQIRQGLALVLAQPLGPTRATLNRLTWVLVVVGGAGIVLAALGGLGVARTALRPVQRLTAAAEHVARTGQLQPISQPIPLVGEDDELASLTRSFNAMLAALNESRERQRRLVADAGHELRTPLTSLRTNLELLLASQLPDAPHRLSEEDRTEIYADVRAQIEELTTLIGDLVELARDDGPQTVHEQVELVEVVERALDRARRRAPGLEFDVQLRPWTIVGDGSALERAALNLLDNAAKWSPPGGRVRVELRPAGQGVAVFEVADAGPGIAEADLPLVFDRFYRSSEARTLPGSGLGLAIVRQVAERHGGTVTAGRAMEGGALLSLWLPGTPEPPDPYQPPPPS